ncbi:MAG: amidohydrolase, partial [Blastocatellia bacterium]
MRIVDSHQHFWEVGKFEYPWMSPELGVLYQDYLPDQLNPVLKENGVSRTVLVQASNSLDETEWMLKLAATTTHVYGVVGWVDLMSPFVDQQLQKFKVNERFKGVRHLVESEPADDWLVQPEVLKGLKCLEQHELSYDLLVHTRHLKYVPKIVEECPNLSLVIDHMAKPPIRSGEIEEWAKELKVVAQHNTIFCKLSGLVTEADTLWTTDDLRPYVECALELFGPERLMFGSDHPVCLLAASYKEVLESFQDLL